MEKQLRRRKFVAGEEAVTSFYSRHLLQNVIDTGTPNIFIHSHGEVKLLMREEDLLTGVSVDKDLIDFPGAVEIAGDQWKLSCVFKHGL